MFLKVVTLTEGVSVGLFLGAGAENSENILYFSLKNMLLNLGKSK